MESSDKSSCAHLPPIVSLISKSSKARTRLKPGTWQHEMLGKNLRALHIAEALISGDSSGDEWSREELQFALAELVAIRIKSVTAQARFPVGTSQYSLLKSRIAALQAAEQQIIQAEQGVAPQSATRSESNSEGVYKPQPEAEGRSQ